SMPCSSQPVKGSSFYIGYEELLYKDLDALSLTLDWLDVPADLGTYYDGYPRFRFTNIHTVQSSPSGAASASRFSVASNRFTTSAPQEKRFSISPAFFVNAY